MFEEPGLQRLSRVFVEFPGLTSGAVSVIDADIVKRFT
jgi:hypothetical protein